MEPIDASNQEHPQCQCGCGEPIPEHVLHDARSRGKVGKFVDALHRNRYHQRESNRRRALNRREAKKANT
jgi:hypothetical protein